MPVENTQLWVLDFIFSTHDANKRTQTFRERKRFGVHNGAEFLVVDQVFVVVGAEQRVVSHHLIVEGRGRLIHTRLRVGHPQRVCVLLVAHSGHVLPDFTQGASEVLHPEELQRSGSLVHVYVWCSTRAGSTRTWKASTSGRDVCGVTDSSLVPLTWKHFITFCSTSVVSGVIL